MEGPNKQTKSVMMQCGIKRTGMKFEGTRYMEGHWGHAIWRGALGPSIKVWMTEV